MACQPCEKVNIQNVYSAWMYNIARWTWVWDLAAIIRHYATFFFLSWQLSRKCILGVFEVRSMQRCTLQILNKRSASPGTLSVLALPDFGLDSHSKDACSLCALGAWKYAVWDTAFVLNVLCMPPVYLLCKWKWLAFKSAFSCDFSIFCDN